MSLRIGVLLPRSTDYPSIGFDLLDGLRCRLKMEGISEAIVIPESIGFGEDRTVTYSKAEKLFLQDEIDILIAYLSVTNAEQLYPLIQTVNKPMIVLDPGMNQHTEKASPLVIHVSLQGILGSYLAGKKAAENGAEVIMATSFYDGGYRGPWAYSQGIEDAGGSIVHNYVGHYKESEFTIKPFLEAIEETKSARIGACFSTYLSGMFMNRLSEEHENLPVSDYYCSPFMFEKQMLDNYPLPKGNFYAFSGWLPELSNAANTEFKATIQSEKQKTSGIFHLLGWESGIIAGMIFRQADAANSRMDEVLRTLTDFQYDSPRGRVIVHPETRATYAPMYFTKLIAGENDKCALEVLDTIEVTPDEHLDIMNRQPTGMTSGWFNNYLCS